MTPQPDFGGFVTTYTDITKRQRAEQALRESQAKLQAIADNSPAVIGLKNPDGVYTFVNRRFAEANPRYAQAGGSAHDAFYREKTGVDATGASLGDPKDIATYSHMFGCWETLFFMKDAVEQSGYRERSDQDVARLIETIESFQWINEGIAHPQGAKKFDGRLHQSFGSQFISKVGNKKLNVVHRTTIEDGLYEPEADYTKQSL